MDKLLLAVKIAITVLVLILFVQNIAVVEVRFLTWSVSLPLALLLVALAAVVAVAIGEQVALAAGYTSLRRFNEAIRATFHRACKCFTSGCFRRSSSSPYTPA